MQASSHLELAYQLLRLFPGIQPVEREAFLFGSVEPDLNALTYLKGIAHGMGLHGHNYAQVLPRIVRLSALLKDRQAWRVQDYYRMGKLVHYVADAFTLPHNTAFQGNLRAHIRYEMRLAACFHSALSHAERMFCTPVRHVDFPGLLRWRHHLYEHEVQGVENDIFCILETSVAAVMAFVPSVTYRALPVPLPQLGGALR